MGHGFAIVLAHVGTLQSLRSLRRRLPWALGLQHMGTTSLIYGAIEVPISIAAMDTTIEQAIASLPEVDEWPFLVRSMFSQTTGHRGIEYGSRVIHFGASYKELEPEWDIWLKKFEDFLARLPGSAAVVHLESELHGDHRVEWTRVFTDGNGSWQLTSQPISF